MLQKMLHASVTSFLLMAVPAFAVNALIQYLFGEVDYQLAAATAVILGAFWTVFTKSGNRA